MTEIEKQRAFSSSQADFFRMCSSREIMNIVCEKMQRTSISEQNIKI